MIYNFIPYAPQTQHANLGWVYNQYMQLLPNDNDYACFLDHDAMFTTRDWYKQLEHIILKTPNFGIMTAKTNRIGNMIQVLKEADPNNHDIKYHRILGEKLQKEKYDVLTTMTSKTPISGVVILIQKKTWKTINGVKDGFFGVDNDFHYRCLTKNLPCYLMEGVYCYHWYRGDGKHTKDFI